jgi:hypothetical protein
MPQRPSRTPRARAPGLGRVLLFAAVVVGAFAPMPTASAAPTICVALVVDFTPLNGGVDSACTRVPQGANGYDVLRAGHHTYGICANGIVGTIDGQPANGCQTKDSTHFWGYWHRKPGSRTWTFSNFGAGGYHPVEGSTEGWVWENGTTSPPADTSYPSGCHSPPASATPTPRPSAHSSPASAGAHGGTSSGANAGSTSTRRSPSPTGAAEQRNGARRRVSPSAGALQRFTPTPPGGTVDGNAPTPTSTASAISGAPPAAGGGGHLAGLAAGLGVAALLGAGAWWRSRRTGAAS